MEFLAAFYDALESRVVAAITWLSLDFYEVALVFLALFFTFVVYRLHRSKDAEFSFEQFFTHGDRPGKGDLFKLLAFGAWMIHSWVIVRQEVYGHLDESTMATYAGLWSGAYVVLKGFQAFGGKSLLPPPSSPSDSKGDTK